MSAPLVVFGEDWGAHPSSTQHLVRRLAERRDVIWVNSIGMRRPRLSLKDLQRVAGKLRRRRQPPAPPAATPPRLSVVEPFAISWPGQPLARRANRHLLGRRLRGELAARGLERPVLWLSLPTAVDVVGELGERAVVYYVGDDFGALEGVDHAPVQRMEEELVGAADMVLAASSVLAARLNGPRTRFLPHGVDFELFAGTCEPAADLPRRGPVAGFYGGMDDRFDVPLVEATARLLPQWQFVLIGPEKTELGALRVLPNVRLLGPRPHERLPAYAAHWDAAILPFRDTAMVRACNPLKLREYLAAGRPIVTTDMPALDGYRDLVSLAGTPQAIAEALQACRGEGPNEPARRRARVAPESWAARVAEVESLLGQFD
jgi:glycosyltransferase involved in cell wall biosynthesis